MLNKNRVNLFKKIVGYYMSSKIWEFRMRCPNCT